MGLNGRKLLQIKMVVIVLVSTFSFAQEAKIKSIKPFLQNKKLVVKTVFENLLNEDLTDGLASGMARTLNFRFDLIQKNGKKIEEFNRVVKLRYDVWEDIYFLTKRKQRNQFSQFEKLNHFLNDSLSFTLLSSNRLSYEKSMQVVMYFSPENISEAQKRKLEYWMDDEKGLEKKTNSDGNQSAFSINLSTIISLFTSQGSPKNATIGRSIIFTIKSLKLNENPSK